MKDIVDSTIPILLPMSHGYWGTLSDMDQIRLSAWITLFCMSYEFAHKETVCVPQSERTIFSKRSIPSDRWFIAIGYGEPGPVYERTLHRSFSLGDDIDYEGHRHFQVTTFYFGKLLAVAYYSEFDITFDFKRFSALNGLTILWPLDGPLRKPFRVHYDEAPEALLEIISQMIRESI